MAKQTLLEIAKELREYNQNSEWVKEFNKKYQDFLQNNDYNINFQGRYKLTNKNGINILYKNKVAGLNFVKHTRPAGYYILISGFKNEEQKIGIGVGETFIKDSYGTTEYSDFLEEKPYKAAILKLEEEGEKIPNELKVQNFRNINLDTCSEEYFNSMVDGYKKIISKYPDVMKDYIEENKEINFDNKYEEYWKWRENNNTKGKKVKGKSRRRNAGKNNGKLFSTYIWTVMKKENNLNPEFGEDNKVLQENQYEVNENTTKYELNKNENKLGKNVIIYGVPGSGKSYFVKNEILNGVKPEQYERVIFYPEYMYCDFVGQKVPADNGQGLEFEPGPFARILEKAINDKNKKHYYLIIEEMNRGNAEAIFGDILQLLDRRKDGRSEYEIDNRLLKEFINEKAKNKVDKIYIPSNLSIYATINNSDQNVFNLDTAFSRRWEYEGKSCNPKESEVSDSAKIYFYNKINGTKYVWNDIRKKLNEIIVNTEEVYNKEDKQIGLFYIDKDCLEEEIKGQDEYYRKKFANKIFRYLWLDVFKNCKDEIFDLEHGKTLEDFVNNFKLNGNLENILKLKLEDNYEEN